MLIVIDNRIPDEAKNCLSEYGQVVEFTTQNITYPAISSHPDIFLCQTPESLICAPNLPEKYFDLFKKEKINFDLGRNPVGVNFPDTAFYNCVVNDDFIFHKNAYTDLRILEQNKAIEFINLPQAYTRCSLMSLPEENYITSDKGIEQVMKEHDFNVSYFSSEEIILPTMPHGFIGGALGYYSGRLFIIGNPDFHIWGQEFRDLLSRLKIEPVFLYDGPFFDGGGIFFLE